MESPKIPTPLEPSIRERHLEAFGAISKRKLGTGKPSSEHYQDATKFVEKQRNLLAHKDQPRARKVFTMNCKVLLDQLPKQVELAGQSVPDEAAKKFRAEIDALLTDIEKKSPEFNGHSHETLGELVGLMQRSYTQTGRDMGMLPNDAKARDVQLQSPKGKDKSLPQPSGLDRPKDPPLSRVRINEREPR